ncbi:MAG: hypothetical protein LAO55_17500 [Acidobacteriia bacterium]|nr:hypothetical protein [Terriglobia bacterium]
MGIKQGPGATLRLFSLGALLALASVSAHADTISLGFVSFDILIPGAPELPGVNAFSITNFTGSNSLSPDFPVATDLSFLGSSLTLAGDFNGTVNIGTVVPGSTSPAALEFPETTLFSSATFSANLSQTIFALSDGRTFQATDRALSVELLPFSGLNLSPSLDFAVITVEATEVRSAVPEPSYGYILCVAFVAAYLVRSPRRGRRPLGV